LGIVCLPELPAVLARKGKQGGYIGPGLVPELYDQVVAAMFSLPANIADQQTGKGVEKEKDLDGCHSQVEEVVVAPDMGQLM
jgi:hypothetical protein